MLYAFFVGVAVALAHVLITIAKIFNYPISAITYVFNQVQSFINPYLNLVGNFVELSTFYYCIGAVIALELIIRGWEIFTTMLTFRK